MNRLLLIICIFVSLTSGGARDTQTMAQTPPQPASAEIKPCDATNAKGKPTLKRRQPVQNISTVDQDSEDREFSQNQNCTHQLSEGESANDQNPVRIEFEGLHAFADSDVLRAFREERVALPIDRLPGVDAIDKASAVLPPACADVWRIIQNTPSSASTGKYLTCANVGWSTRLGVRDICKRRRKSPGLPSRRKG